MNEDKFIPGSAPLAAALKGERIGLGMTVSAAAQKGGLSEERLTEIERGYKSDVPTWRELSCLLVKVYNTPRRLTCRILNEWALMLVGCWTAFDLISPDQCLVCSRTHSTKPPCLWVSPSRILCSRCADEIVGELARTRVDGGALE